MEYDIKEFDEIRPYEAGEMKQAFNDLLNDRQFSLVLKGFAPWLPKGIRNGLLKLLFVGIKTPLDFQKRFMKPVVNWIIRKHTDGCTFDDDILQATDPNFEQRMNKAFTVRRGLTAHEMMRSSQLMSSYIHYAVNQKRENIWIAQREGRAKDSSDHTQDSVLKMLAMGSTASDGTLADKLRDLNIVPLTISYEYDPCDYLKAQEFQQKRDTPAFKKSKQDDLDNMKTGIFGYKGRVHYQCGTPINQWIDELNSLPRNEFFAQLSLRIDREIHGGYRLYPCNYIAYDRLEGEQYSQYYTEADVERFDKYLADQLAKIQIPNKDEEFLRERMLTMYANPVRNNMKVIL